MSEDSTGGATSSKREAAQVMAEVGGVRSSDDPVPGLWFGQPTEERRDATCSAEVKSSEGRGDGPQGLQAPMNVRQLQITLGRRASDLRQRNSESRMRENRSSGLMRGGKQTVIGPRASQAIASRLLYAPWAPVSVRSHLASVLYQRQSGERMEEFLLRTTARIISPVGLPERGFGSLTANPSCGCARGSGEDCASCNATSRSRNPAPRLPWEKVGGRFHPAPGL